MLCKKKGKKKAINITIMKKIDIYNEKNAQIKNNYQNYSLEYV